MFDFVWKIIWIFGVLVNFWLLRNLSLRPLLWSTVNIFLGVVLLFNTLILAEKLCFEIGAFKNEGDDLMVLALENLFNDHPNSISCTLDVLAHFFHGFSTLMILIGILFIRSIMIKHAEDVRSNSHVHKLHQAEISLLGFLVAFFIFTICCGVLISIFISPLFPFKLVRVQMCRGINFTYSKEEQIKIGHRSMTRVACGILTLLFTVSCHVRILSYKRRHAKSYFSQYRQNIVTANQTLTSSYVKIILFFSKEIIQVCLLIGIRTFDFNVVIQTHTIIDMILLPSFCIYSSRTEFRELWAEETLFWRSSTKKNNIFTSSRNLQVKKARGPYVTEGELLAVSSN
jgi:hypothetical protein